MAGSLTFTILLSIVPFRTMGFDQFSRLPALSRFEALIEAHLLASMLPADIARTVISYLDQFAAKVDGLTWTRVRWRDAMVGGLIASVLLESGQRGLSM